MPWIARRAFASSKPILLGVPTASTAAVGVADDLDHINGTTLAMDEINASGGSSAAMKLFVTDLDKLSPESCQQAIAPASMPKCMRSRTPSCSCRSRPWMYRRNTNAPICRANRARRRAFKADPEKYSHIFQPDPSEVNYGWTYPKWLEDAKEAGRVEAEEPQGPYRPGADCLYPDHLERRPGGTQEARQI